MPGPFAITAASNTIVLDNRRQGQASFTVTNVSGRPLRGRARLVPQNPAVASWLSIAGEFERDFTIGDTQQYVVQVAVPFNASAGNYPLRFDEVGVDNPDEDFTEGPSVTFGVPASQPPLPAFPWWILAGGLAAILVMGLGAWWALAGGGGQGNGAATATALAAAKATQTAQAAVTQTALAQQGANVTATARAAATATAVAATAATARVAATQTAFAAGRVLAVVGTVEIVDRTIFVEQRGTLAINEKFPVKPQSSPPHHFEKCVGSTSVDLDISVSLRSDLTSVVSINAALYQGFSCSHDQRLDARTDTVLVPPGGTTVSWHALLAGSGGDSAEFNLVLTNSNPQ